MREIKFRAYIRDLNKVVDVKQIDLIYKYFWFEEEGNPRDKMRMLDQCDLMQFTGLYDKNGKEIYEGDILKMHLGCDQMDITEIGVVEYYKGTFGIVSDERKHFLSFYNMSVYVSDIEVLGNIYENKKLIEKE